MEDGKENRFVLGEEFNGAVAGGELVHLSSWNGREFSSSHVEDLSVVIGVEVLSEIVALNNGKPNSRGGDMENGVGLGSRRV